MKKLTTLVILALFVTIGGVYAAWHYAIGDVSLEITRSGTMASVQSDTNKGSIAVDNNANNAQGNTIKFLVDDIDDIDWKAELIPSGSVWIKFTPASTADPDVRQNGIKMMATVTITGTQTEYDGKKIFTTAADNTFVVNETATKDSIQITAQQIADCLVFNEGAEVILDTYQENVAYEEAMQSYIITIIISEVPAT